MKPLSIYLASAGVNKSGIINPLLAIHIYKALLQTYSHIHECHMHMLTSKGFVPEDIRMYGRILIFTNAKALSSIEQECWWWCILCGCIQLHISWYHGHNAIYACTLGLKLKCQVAYFAHLQRIMAFDVCVCVWGVRVRNKTFNQYLIRSI